MLVRLLSDPDSAEEARIHDWIAADPRHAVAFARAECAWEQAGSLANTSRLSVDDGAAAPSYRRHHVRSFMLGGVAAASLLLASSAAPSQTDIALASARCQSSKLP
ncbi:FecR/PupR family sigma factor regulator [Sphingobium algorifonticola]|uniref:FecR/PupR family sigma factor regulator n=1 Tax=Sphingobium algorifonticola TaxID=2008318 RepID=UPI001F49DD44|nr:DUF4880 domain-containing protein [Sphingobium algorifonticola]